MHFDKHYKIIQIAEALLTIFMLTTLVIFGGQLELNEWSGMSFPVFEGKVIDYNEFLFGGCLEF